MDLKETYNKIAEDWHKDHSADSWWVEGTEYLLSLLPAHTTILDIGCGSGVKSAYLAGKGFVVTGGDFSEKMVEIARREVPGVIFEVLDFYNLDTWPQSYDCVFAQAALLHIPKKDIPAILENLKHVLKKDGLLYLAVKELRPNARDEEMKTENDYGYEYQRFFSYFTVPELTSFLEHAGLTIVHESVTPSNNTNWIQIIARK